MGMQYKFKNNFTFKSGFILGLILFSLFGLYLSFSDFLAGENKIFFLFVLLLFVFVFVYFLDRGRVLVDDKGIIYIPSFVKIASNMMGQFEVNNYSVGGGNNAYKIDKKNVKKISLLSYEEFKKVKKSDDKSVDLSLVNNGKKVVCFEFKSGLEFVNKSLPQPKIKKVYFSLSKPEELIKFIKRGVR